ncbi:class I SAM-dependent methyltransferase [Oceaniserpentilla sp. 4NH20-0058]|uniref:class I SAM-dependent methyltransferase n=1 Tax=Oceaniserpentilla sp. 4NH20-0058 TaxID=3127660 RepID=UPI0031027D9E
MSLTLVCHTVELAEKAQNIADELTIQLSKKIPDQAEFILKLDESGLSLCKPFDKSVGDLTIDFTDGALTWRRQHGGGTGQAIAKAVGLKQKKALSVLDATAGTATDAFVLAALGCKVTMVERHPIVAALLQDALERAELNPEVHEITQHMTLHKGSSIEYLQTCEAEQFDVVCLDPMFPHSGKNAQVKKSMQFFRDMVGKDEDADLLLPPALNAAKYRVVVKRPRKSPFLNNQKPSLSQEGKANRFDIYVNKGMKD